MKKRTLSLQPLSLKKIVSEIRTEEQELRKNKKEFRREFNKWGKLKSH